MWKKEKILGGDLEASNHAYPHTHQIKNFGAENPSENSSAEKCL